MIRELQVENIGIIERSSIRLGPGLTALTGETGAGKSLLVDAVGLVLGDRADSTLLRTGASRAVVSMSFEIGDRIDVVALLDAHVLAPAHGRVEFQREIVAEGRSVCRVDGKPTTLASLRSIGESLVDLHGQHEHQALLDPAKHLAFLDAWIGEPVKLILSDLREKLSDFERLNRDLRELELGSQRREHELDMLRFAVREIEEACIKPGELNALEQSNQRLQNTERLAHWIESASEQLEDQDRARDLTASALQSLRSAAAVDESLLPIQQSLEDALFSLEDTVAKLSNYASTLESDPQLLEANLERIELIKKLARKYGGSETSILESLEDSRRKLDNLENCEVRLGELEERVSILESILNETAGRLSTIRKNAAPNFAKFVQSELCELAMEKAKFSCAFDEKVIDASGSDEFEFLFSANPGEQLRPLSRIASGGEISRVMLALKVVLAGKAGAPTLIFDEVDIGLSGRAAAVVAKKLRKLSDRYQVIVISHLPQIAAAADVHYKIEKSEVEGRTATQLTLLDDQSRIDEIARMLAGEIIGESALANARELLYSSATES